MLTHTPPKSWAHWLPLVGEDASRTNVAQVDEVGIPLGVGVVRTIVSPRYKGTTPYIFLSTITQLIDFDVGAL